MFGLIKENQWETVGGKGLFNCFWNGSHAIPQQRGIVQISAKRGPASRFVVKQIANLCNLSRIVDDVKNDGSRLKYSTSKRSEY